MSSPHTFVCLQGKFFFFPQRNLHWLHSLSGWSPEGRNLCWVLAELSSNQPSAWISIETHIGGLIAPPSPGTPFCRSPVQLCIQPGSGGGNGARFHISKSEPSPTESHPAHFPQMSLAKHYVWGITRTLPQESLTTSLYLTPSWTEKNGSRRLYKANAKLNSPLPISRKIK